jgi:AraC-like DNA-binding protein
MTKPISRIAEELCFADASSFSRAFRLEFGQSPSEVRSAALVGLALPTTSRNRPMCKAGNFGELVRDF